MVNINIYSHCIAIEVFPDNRKVVKVIHIYKSGDKHNPSNYMLIWLLFNFFQNFEKLIDHNLSSFLVKNKVHFPRTAWIL